MNTPEFDKIVSAITNERRKAAVKRLDTTILNIASIMLFSSLSCLFSGIFGIIDQAKGSNDSVNKTINKISGLGTIAALFALGIVFIIGLVVDESVFEEEKNDNARKMFMDKIAGEYGPQDFEAAKNLAEYVLSYMTSDQKTKIKTAYKNLDLNDKDAVDKFVELVKGISTMVVANTPGMQENLPDIAAGKTYMFYGWNYGKPGHGGR